MPAELDKHGASFRLLMRRPAKLDALHSTMRDTLLPNLSGLPTFRVSGRNACETDWELGAI
jgi:hypothetical protein